MSESHQFSRADGSVVDVAITDRRDGDFHIDAEPGALARRRADVLGPGRWKVVRQVHGAVVVDAADVPHDPFRAPEADALVTDEIESPIAVQGADCAPIAFVTELGPVAVAHAGWRGLAAGIVDSVVDELARRGSRVDRAIVGPVIGPECYEFGPSDLVMMTAQFGDAVRSVTESGAPALDMSAAISAACAASGVSHVQFIGACTACGGSGFSYRARAESQRHALVAQIRSGVGDTNG